MASPLPLMKSLSRLCFITPVDRDTEATGVIVRTALEAGVKWVQYRRKETARRQLYAEAFYLRQLTADFGASLIINDYADIAIAVEADGLPLGQDDLPLGEARKAAGDMIIGVSAHSLAEALAAMRGGADYIGFGPIFYTDTKDAGKPKGPEAISRIKKAAIMPLIAIGGITRYNAKEVFAAGCDGIAVSAGISRGDVAANVRAILGITGC
jgi:thiamine-phosphate pyrophosphorylase